MVIQSSGKYGNYYRSQDGTSEALSTTQMRTNANYIRAYLEDEGWTINAICGLLGNMQSESAINPSRWQSNDVGNMDGGYGLTQWTPATKYINWAKENGFTDYGSMDGNLARIIYELNNGGQYYPTSNYKETFKEFSKSTESPYYLACVFAWNYERSAVVLYGDEEEKEALRKARGGNANTWYEYLTGTTPPSPPPTPSTSTRRRKGYNFVLFKRKRWKY